MKVDGLGRLASNKMAQQTGQTGFGVRHPCLYSKHNRATQVLSTGESRYRNGRLEDLHRGVP